jgi:hypothetical protein
MVAVPVLWTYFRMRLRRPMFAVFVALTHSTIEPTCAAFVAPPSWVETSVVPPAFPSEVVENRAGEPVDSPPLPVGLLM